MKTALIFGIGGQDGSYLADLLLEKGYDVHGTSRRSSGDNLARIAHCRGRVSLHRVDLADPYSVLAVLQSVSPDEVYNEADQDHVGWSKALPAYALQVTVGGPLAILEAMKFLQDQGGPNWKEMKFFQPVSATMFGAPTTHPQTEESPLDPRSPYACAKAHTYHLCRYYRREHGLFVSTGIMYTHDSPRRGPGYLLQDLCYKGKFLQTAMQARLDSAVLRTGDPLTMVVGDPDAEVDVGFAGDYVNAAWQILQLDKPNDFIISTGETDRVGNIAEEVLRQFGVVGGRVVRDPDYPKSLNQGRLVGDYLKLHKATGWVPEVGTRDLIRLIREAHNARP